MNYKVKVLYLSVGLLLMVQSSYGKLKLPAILSSDMVLQRNTEVTLWGWSDAHEKITIETSWLGSELNVKADNTGKWHTKVETGNSKSSQKIKIKGKDSEIVLSNILFGEVWFCSGQSNMFQPLTGYTGEPVFNSSMTIAKSNNPNLRLFNVAKVGSKEPQNDLKEYSPWRKASPEVVAEFSAVAYFFGQQLQEILDVPVGIIHASWGASVVEAWISSEVLSDYENVDLDDLDILHRTNKIPTALFNSMINPIIPLTLKGMLWYQGESNRLEPSNYLKLFPAMVKDWRSRWQLGNIPFYYVQIAPFTYGTNEAFQSTENSALMREAQLKCLELIPNSGMAVTLDIGDAQTVHPSKKKEVADRLLFHALNQTYGLHTVDCLAPFYSSQENNLDGLMLKFRNAETGLFCDGELEGFEIAGSDKVFFPAKAVIVKGKEVFVRSDQVPDPVAVRYGWRNWIRGTLFDVNLLPASSFRTDNWENASRAQISEN